MRRRVVVTGMGVITPLGHSPAELFANVVAGKTAEVNLAPPKK